MINSTSEDNLGAFLYFLKALIAHEFLDPIFQFRKVSSSTLHMEVHLVMHLENALGICKQFG